MDETRTAEWTLVATIALSLTDPAALTRHLTAADFADPAAGLLFGRLCQVAERSRAVPGGDVLRLLTDRGELRSDGYPVSALLPWLSRVPVPAHPELYAALVVRGALGRQLEQAGGRLVQAASGALERGGAGRAFAAAVAQRSAIRAGVRRWSQLPPQWRSGVPDPHVDAVEVPGGDGSPGGADAPLTVSTADVAGSAQRGGPDAVAAERQTVGSLLLAPQAHSLLAGWLHPADFSDPACAAVYVRIGDLRTTGRTVDPVSVASALHSRSGRLHHRTRQALTGVVRPVAVPAEGWSGWLRQLQAEVVLPGSVTVPARGVLDAAAVRHAEAAGWDLVALADPGAGGAPGALTAALARLEVLHQVQQRWQLAHTAPARRRAASLHSAGPDRAGAVLRHPDLDRGAVTRPAAGVRRSAG